MVAPSGETLSETIGAVWPSSTVVGLVSPGRHTATRPSSPPVTMRPSGATATALTALSWKRSTCSAELRVSDQRIAELSKLPEIAAVPSGEIASARTGPPWPRSWAWAGERRQEHKYNCEKMERAGAPASPPPLAGEG